MTVEIAYAVENGLGADEFIDILKRSGLAERRPVNQRARIEGMLEHANLIVTARNRDRLLVGVSRCLTDFAFCCYCADLAVDAACQGQGIGVRLIEESKTAASEYAHFFLLSAPGAVSFYEKIGMTRHPNCFERTDWNRLGGDGDNDA